VAIFEGDIQRRDGTCTGSAGRGPEAKGVSASTVSRLKQVWAQEYRNWSNDRLDKKQLGLCLGRRRLQRSESGTGKAMCPGVIGVNERGEKRFLAIEDGVRESHKAGARYC